MPGTGISGQPSSGRRTAPGNLRSAWDPHWIANAPHENRFYVALPYNDLLDSSHTNPEAAAVVPWFRRSFVRPGQSVLRGRWVEIRVSSEIICEYEAVAVNKVRTAGLFANGVRRSVMLFEWLSPSMGLTTFLTMTRFGVSNGLVALATTRACRATPESPSA
jgi:hypothetical protein